MAVWKMTWHYAEHYTVVLISNVFYLHCRSLVPPQTEFWENPLVIHILLVLQKQTKENWLRPSSQTLNTLNTLFNSLEGQINKHSR